MNCRDIDKKCRENIDCRTDCIREIICDMCAAGGAISMDYAGVIADSVMEEVVDDIISSADCEDWNGDDVKLAFSRALCKKLGILI